MIKCEFQPIFFVIYSVGEQRGGQGFNCDFLAWHAGDCEQRHNGWRHWVVSPLKFLYPLLIW